MWRETFRGRSIKSEYSLSLSNWRKKTLFTIPVAVGENGTYSVSWSTAHEASPSGTYKVIIYREADRLRSSERKAKKETEGELPVDIILFHIDFDH